MWKRAGQPPFFFSTNRSLLWSFAFSMSHKIYRFSFLLWKWGPKVGEVTLCRLDEWTTEKFVFCSRVSSFMVLMKNRFKTKGIPFPMMYNMWPIIKLWSYYQLPNLKNNMTMMWFILQWEWDLTSQILIYLMKFMWILHNIHVCSKFALNSKYSGQCSWLYLWLQSIPCEIHSKCIEQ